MTKDEAESVIEESIRECREQSAILRAERDAYYAKVKKRCTEGPKWRQWLWRMWEDFSPP